jgi:hypothetical protein
MNCLEGRRMGRVVIYGEDVVFGGGVMWEERGVSV